MMLTRKFCDRYIPTKKPIVIFIYWAYFSLIIKIPEAIAKIKSVFKVNSDDICNPKSP